MKIKKFETLNNFNGYTKEIDNNIDKYNSAEEKIIYFVSTTDDDKPYKRTEHIELENALIRMNKLNVDWINEYCIFECKIKALKKSDIDISNNIKKYNL